MFRTPSPIIRRVSVSLLLCCSLLIGAAPAIAQSTDNPELHLIEVPAEFWQPLPGDRLAVDTLENEAFLVHATGQYVRFPVATGQKRWVRYIGLNYFAATPERMWVAKSKEIKGDRVTYGEDGLFLRLFYKGERTSYGIHAYAGDRLHEGDRFRSMGCIVPQRAMLAIVEQTFGLNASELIVVTKKGIDDPYAVAFL